MAATLALEHALYEDQRFGADDQTLGLVELARDDEVERAALVLQEQEGGRKAKCPREDPVRL
jgi:hypothetical protein